MTKEQFSTKFDAIQRELSAARAAGDMAAIKRARRKLERWQDQYGATSPIQR